MKKPSVATTLIVATVLAAGTIVGHRLSRGDTPASANTTARSAVQPSPTGKFLDDTDYDRVKALRLEWQDSERRQAIAESKIPKAISEEIKREIEQRQSIGQKLNPLLDELRRKYDCPGCVLSKEMTQVVKPPQP